MTKIEYEITEALEDQQLLIVRFYKPGTDEFHELAIEYPEEELPDADLDAYVQQFAPRSVVPNNIEKGAFQKHIGKRRSVDQPIRITQRLLRFD